MILLDTCFLIALQREFRRNEEGKARLFLKRHAQDVFAVSVISVTEFLEGFDPPADGEIFLRPFRLLDVSLEVAREAAKIRRRLRINGTLIGDFDILIAATAIVGGLSLATDNAAHFERVEGLNWENYRGCT